MARENFNQWLEKKKQQYSGGYANQTYSSGNTDFQQWLATKKQQYSGSGSYSGSSSQNSTSSLDNPLEQRVEAVSSSLAAAGTAGLLSGMASRADNSSGTAGADLGASLDNRIKEAQRKLDEAKAKRKAAINSRPGLVLVNGKPKMQTSTAMAEADRESTAARYELEAAQREKYFNEQSENIAQIQENVMNTDEYQRALENIQNNVNAAVDNRGKLNRSAGLYDFRAGEGSIQYSFMTDEEKAVYNALKLTSPEQVQDYEEYLQYVLNERVAQSEAETLDKMGTLGNILGYVGAGLTAPKTLITQGIDAIFGAFSDEYKPVDYNAPGYRSSRIQAETRENLLGNIESPTLNFLAGLGLDLLSMAVTRGFGGAVGGRFASTVARGMMGAQSSGNSIYEAGINGVPAEDAFTLGVLNGLTEILTEKMPVDRFFDLVRGGAKLINRGVVKNILIQAGIEGSEELVSSYVQSLNDIAIRGNDSQWGRAVSTYMEEGLSREEAEHKANVDVFVIDPLLSFTGGAIGGGVFGAGATMIGSLRGGRGGTNENRQGHIPLTDEDLAEYLQTGKRQSTRNKKNRMVEEGQSPILTTAQSITSFIKDAISGKTKHVTKAYGKVGADLAAAVAEKSGGKLDISGKYLELSADELKHSYDVHHNPKQAGDIPLSQEHFENIIDYIDNFDDILYVQDQGKFGTRIGIGKKINGYSVITEVVSNERNALHPVGIWGMSTEKYNRLYKNRGTVSGAVARPESATHLTLYRSTSDPNITQGQGEVNDANRGTVSERQLENQSAPSSYRSTSDPNIAQGQGEVNDDALVGGMRRNNQPLDAQTTEPYNEIEDSNSVGLDEKLNGRIDNGRVDDRWLGIEDLYRGELGRTVHQGVRASERFGAERQQAAGRGREIPGTDSEGRRIDPGTAEKLRETAVVDELNRPKRLYHAFHPEQVIWLDDGLGQTPYEPITPFPAILPVNFTEEDFLFEDIHEVAVREQEKLISTLKEVVIKLVKEIIDPGAKSVASMRRKIRRKRAAGIDYNILSMKDHVRAALIVDDLSQVGELISVLKEKYPSMQGEAYIDTPLNNTGYRGIHLTVNMENGINGEIQIATPEAWRIKKETDEIYDKWRNVSEKDMTKAQLQERANDYARSQKLWEDYYSGITPEVKRAASAAVSGLVSNQSSNTPSYGTQEEPLNSTVRNSELGYAKSLPSSVSPNLISTESSPSNSSIAQEQEEVNVRAAQTAVQDRAEQLRQAVENEDTQAVMESMGEQGLKVYLDNRLHQNKQQEREYSLYYRAGMEGVAYEQVAGKFGNSLNPALQEMAFNAGKMDAETVRNAVYFGKDSGLVRDKNFRKAKIGDKLARALDALAKVMGLRIRFADNLPDGVNAVYRDGEIIISLKADDPVKVLVGHEIVHRLRETDPRAYNALYAFVEQYMGAEDFQRSVSMRQELYRQETGEMDMDGAIEETVADAIGRMLGDTAFFESFVMERPNLAQKIKDILQTLIGRVRRWLGASVELSQSQRQEFAELQAHLEELMRTMDAAMQRAEIRTKARGPQGTSRNKTANTTKKALSAKFAQEVDEWYRLPAEERAKEGGNFYVGTTSDALKSIGVDDYRIYWGKAKVAAIMKKHPKMTLDVIKKVPQVIEKPIIVMQSQTVLNRITILGEVTTDDGTPVLVAMELRPKNKRGEVMDFGVIASAYEKQNAQRLIDSSDILYIEPNKNRTTAWTETLGLQLPSVISKRGSIGTVTYVEGNVKGTAAFDDKQGKTTMQLAMEKAKERANDKLNKATDNNSIAANSQNDTGNIRTGKAKFSLSYDKKGQPMVVVEENIFAGQAGKKAHQVVADFLKKHIGDFYTIIESGQKVYLGDDLPGEYTHSKYTRNLKKTRSTLNAKNQAAQELGEMIEIATNRRWEKANHKEKHAKDAKYGFYRYDTRFAIPLRDARKRIIRYRVFDAELVIRNDANGKKYLYDIVNIKEDRDSELASTLKTRSARDASEEARNSVLLDSTLPQEPGSVNNSIVQNGQNDTGNIRTGKTKAARSTKNLLEMEESDFTYEALTAKPDIEIVTINDRPPYRADGKIDRSALVTEAMKRIREENGGQSAVYIDDAGRWAHINKNALRHSLTRRAEQQALAVMNAGKILENSIVINTAEPEHDGATVAYVVVGIARDQEDNYYVANALIDVYENGEIEVVAMDDVYSVNAKRGKIMEPAAPKASAQEQKFPALTGSKTSIEELLTVVKEYFPDILPRDVLSHYGLERSAKPPIRNLRHSRSTKKLVEQYGAIPRGEQAAREVQVPKRTGEEQAVRRFVRTVLESEATPDMMIPAFDQEIAAGNFSYEPSSDSNAWGKAQKSYRAFGEEGALRQWRAVVNGERPANKDDIALGELLYIKAAEAGETQKAMQLAAEVAAEGTRAGQVVQAMRLLKKMSGAGQLYYINLTRDKLQKDLIKKYGAKAPELEIPEALAQKLAGAKTQAEIDEATEQILGYIAAQMPATWVDKWNAWRYLAMLGNPRTHIRNLVGNSIFMPAVTMKNIIGTGIEAATNKVLAPMFHKGPVERTKTIRGALPFTGREYRDFAINDFDEMYDILTSGGKMNPSDEIRDRQRIFKNKALEWARKQNFNLLEKEDGIFLKAHYVRAMVQYLQANNVDLDQLGNIDSSGHTPEEQRRISEYQNATDGELLNFIDKIRHLQEPKNADKINHLLGEVQPELAAEIERLTGVDVHDFEHNIRGDVVYHIDRRHGKQGLKDHSMADTKDMARIAYVLQNYDDIELGTDDQGNERLSQHWTNADKSPAKKVKISKKIDGTMYIIEAVPDTARKKLQLVTAYIAQNKGVGQTLNMPEGPQHTSETPFASAPLVGAGQELNMPEDPQPTSETLLPSAPGANIAQRNGGVKLSKADIDANMKAVAQMEPVARVSGKEFAKGEKDLVTQVTEFFAGLGNKADNDVLGTIALDRRGAKADIGHGIGRKKAAAFAAVKEVLQQGKVIDYQRDWKGRGYDTAVIAAPVTIGGEPYLMGAVVIRNDGENRFYLHEVWAEKNSAPPFKTGTSGKNSLGTPGGDAHGTPPFKTGTSSNALSTPGGDAPSITNLLQMVEDVKRKLPKKGQIDRDALRMLERARNYAIREAQKATYRDASAVANALNRFSQLNAGTQILTESLMPFKKTPVNLLKRGVRYSPLGLIETLSREVYKLRKGRATGSEFIDNLAAGLSGTMVLGLGYLLASLGLLSGGGDDDKQGQFQELQGWQEYSLQLGDTYYSIDWAAPMSLPLFVGAELYNLFEVDQEVEAKDFYNALTMITEPMFNLSMLNGINNTIEAARYGTSPLTDILIEVGQGYVGQAVPTLLGQIARTIDDTRRTTYTDKNSSWPDDLQYWLQRNRNKIPGLSQSSQPYIDAWGRIETSDNAALRAFENFISPGYISRTNSSKLEEELQRLYDQTGESSVLPSSAPRYFNVDGRRLDLTAAEYSEYAVARGQTAYRLLEDITTSSGYRALSDAAKAAVVEDAFDYANQTAKAEVSRYEVDPWVAKASQAQQQLGVSTSEYLLLKEEYGTQALTADKVYDAYDAGVDVGEYLAFREELSDYAGDNVSQAEARRMLDQTGWTRQQKRAMWNVINKGWKNNPY